MGAREQREQEQHCAEELYMAIKQVINESDCTYRDAISILGKLQMEYRRESGRKKVGR